MSTWVTVVGSCSENFEVALLHWKTYRNYFGQPIAIAIFFGEKSKISLCRLMKPLSKNETRRGGSNPFIVILSSYHYSFCETLS